MKKTQIFSLLIAFSGIFQQSLAQEVKPVIPKSIVVEEMVGDQRQFLQLVANKVFIEKKGIGLLSITSYAADNNNKLSNNEFQNTTLIYHRLYKGIGINSGTSFTSADGMNNFIGLQYLVQTKTFSLIYLPSYYFSSNHKISNTVLIELKPEISGNWSVYSRLQLHYNHNLETDKHYRSYVYGRLGLTYKFFSFGLAHNYDRYGAHALSKINTGIFLKLSM